MEGAALATTCWKGNEKTRRSAGSEYHPRNKRHSMYSPSHMLTRKCFKTRSNAGWDVLAEGIANRGWVSGNRESVH